MKKLLRVALYIFGILFLLIIIGVPISISYLRSSSTIETFLNFEESEDLSFSKMVWRSDSLGNEEIEKVAFFIPVKIEGITDTLYMQFDSGTQTTILYGKTFDALTENNQAIETYYDDDSLRFLKSPTLLLNKLEFEAEKLRIAKTLGNENYDPSFIIIGTIGFDIFVNRTLILDFKNDQLAISDRVTNDLNYNLSYVEDASIDRFPLLVPATVGDKSTNLFYDTGSSMFSLLTSNKRLAKIDDNPADSLCCISSWGRQFPVYKKDLTTPIKIGSSSFDNQPIYSCEVLDMVDYAPSWYLYGITGNRLFDNKIVVIDTKNNLLGIED